MNPYAYNLLIVSEGQSSAEQITQYFRNNAMGGLAYINQRRDDQDLPPLELNPIPDNIGEIIIQTCQTWPDYGVNHDCVATQGGKESAFLQSEIARDKHNPSGLGASNNAPYENAIDCADWKEGFTLTVAHLLSYAVGEGPWTEIDPRWKYMKPGGNAQRWIDLNGKWAYPGNGYGQNIIDRVNTGLFKTEVEMADGQEKYTHGDDSAYAWRPELAKEFGYPQGRFGRNGKPIDYLIVHITEGTDSSNWLRTGHGSSTHYLTNRNASPREQHVREADAAWTAGYRDYNERGINVEFERFIGDSWTDEEYRNAADATLSILKRHNIPLAYLGRNSAGKRGIIGHMDVPDGQGGWGGTDHHTDPGPKFDFNRYISELQKLEAPDADALVLNGFPIILGFRDHFLEVGGVIFPEDPIRGGIALFGLPLDRERQTSFGSSQRFERYVMEYHRDNAPPFDIIGTLRSAPDPQPI